MIQDTTATFDGYGRLKTNHRPEQDANTSTTYNYFADDRIQQVVDARGATVNYQYDNRGLTTQFSTTSPNPSVIPVTPTVIFSYDNLGNRTSMTDGSGTTTYSYSQLSQIVSETKQFIDLPDPFTLQYDYGLTGQVKRIDIFPSNTSVSYNYDKTSRVTSISGQGFSDSNTNATITNIVSEISYRAWNSFKQVSHGNNVSETFKYDNNLKVSSFQIPNLININYQYNADGKAKFADDLINPKFDRSYSYDHKGRLKTAKTAELANGLQPNIPVPFDQTTAYDNFDNIASRSNSHWTQNYGGAQSVANNRRNGWVYNADGDVINFDGNISTQDAVGQQIKIKNKTQYSCNNYLTAVDCLHYKTETSMTADGDGQEVIKNNVRTTDYVVMAQI